MPQTKPSYLEAVKPGEPCGAGGARLCAQRQQQGPQGTAPHAGGRPQARRRGVVVAASVFKISAGAAADLPALCPQSGSEQRAAPTDSLRHTYEVVLAAARSNTKSMKQVMALVR